MASDAVEINLVPGINWVKLFFYNEAEKIILQYFQLERELLQREQRLRQKELVKVKVSLDDL